MYVNSCNRITSFIKKVYAVSDVLTGLSELKVQKTGFGLFDFYKLGYFFFAFYLQFSFARQQLFFNIGILF